MIICVSCSGRHTGAAGVTAGVQTPATLVVGAEKATLTRRTLSGSTPVGDSHVGCGCHPHPAAHISHHNTAGATPPPPGHAEPSPPQAGSPRRCLGGAKVNHPGHRPWVSGFGSSRRR